MLGFLFGFTSRRPAPRRPRPAARPQVEGLEGRCVPAAFLSGGDLVIVQSGGNDSALVSDARVGFQSFLKVQETVDGAIQPVKYFSASAVSRIVYQGGAGDDYFQNFTSVRAVAHGGAGDDALYGGGGADALHGEDGEDVLHGGGGNDGLFGGGGLDFLDGAAGNDYLDGGKDGVADELTGGAGADTFEAEPYYPPHSPYFRPYNRDLPQDSSAAEGDRVVGMPAPVVYGY